MVADGAPPSPLLESRAASAQFVLPAGDLTETMAFFQDRLGFRLDSIYPADDPQTAILSGHGAVLRLEREVEGPAGHVRLLVDGALAEETLLAPNGTRITLAPATVPMVVPSASPAVTVSEVTDRVAFNPGRAGMGYRDLVPDRWGGRFIASHIRIDRGGPVPDYVHYHQVRFQAIYCHKGWVKVVYEDQGDPIVMHPGDCVLQPPEIRHRVLECSDGMEVIEIGCPADHITMVEHDLALPNGVGDPARAWSGQRFVFHRAAEAPWSEGPMPGMRARDTGIGAATDGLANIRVLAPEGTAPLGPLTHDAEFLFFFVLEGAVLLSVAGSEDRRLAAGSSVALPAGTPFRLTPVDGDLRLLEVALPDRYGIEGR